MRIFIGAINCSLCRDEATDVRIAGVVGSGRALFSEGCRMQDKLNFYGCIPAVVSGNESFRSLAFTVQVNTTTTKLFIVYVCTVAETIIQPSDTVCMKSHKNAYRVVADGSSMRGFYKTRKTLFGKFLEFSEV
jgi:hypothetical protein